MPKTLDSESAKRLAASIASSLPTSIEGAVNEPQMQFMIEEAWREQPTTIVELGVASGASAVTWALSQQHLAELSGVDRDEYHVFAYDIAERCYFDASKSVGFAVDEVCPELRRNVSVCAPVTALDFARLHDPRSIDFLFIDANHRAPYPAMDLLLVMDYLSDNALVVFHDINLYKLCPTENARGVDDLFAALDGEWRFSNEETPNIGSWRMWSDRKALRKVLGKTIARSPWDQSPTAEHFWPLMRRLPKRDALTICLGPRRIRRRPGCTDN